MARTFDGTDDQVAFGSEAAIDDLGPWTACALVRITAAVTSERQIITKMTSGFQGQMFLTAYGSGGNNNKIIGVITGDSGVYVETATNILAVDTWKVIISTWSGTYAAPTGHTMKVYSCTLGGVIAEASYISQTSLPGGEFPTSAASATLRVATRDPADTFFAGGLAECALWNRVLGADERIALGRGFAPAFFPRGRVFYSPINGRQSPEINRAGTTHGTVTGTTFLDHPPVIYPSGYFFHFAPAAAGGGFQSAWARNSNVIMRTY